MSATITQIDAQVNDRLARGFSLTDALYNSLNECPVTKSDVARYAENLGVEVKASWSRIQIIAAILAN